MKVIDRGIALIRRDEADSCLHELREVSVYQGMERRVCKQCRDVSFRAVGPSATDTAFQRGQITDDSAH